MKTQTKSRKQCPRCFKTKPLAKFGWRVSRRSRILQSWCVKCRSGGRP